jgi:hypothetical protein
MFHFLFKILPSNQQPHSLVEIPTKTDEISYFYTATTHKHRLDAIPHENKWSCYWVSEYSFRYKPWFFVEVDSHRDLQKMKIFSHRFASRISHICTEHKPRTFQSLESTKWCPLTTFLCSSCISLLFYNCVDNLSSRPCYPSADLHETFRYPPNHQDLQQNCITFRHCTVSYHTWAMLMHSNSEWKVIIPIFHHGGELDLPEWQSWSSTRCNAT